LPSKSFNKTVAYYGDTASPVAGVQYFDVSYLSKITLEMSETETSVVDDLQIR
jgi:hypothetical protein